MKKIIPAIVMLLITTLMVSVTSYAWFSMNTEVTATNMSIKATTDASLVISASTNFVAGSIEVSESGTNIVLRPATTYVDTMRDGSASHNLLEAPSTGLTYVVNTADVDPNTGIEREGKTLYYREATVEAVSGVSSGHYFDFVFYLAAEGEGDVEHGKLVMHIDPLDLSGFSPAEEVLAASSVLPVVNGTVLDTPVHLIDGCSDYELIADLSEDSIPGGAPGVVDTAVCVTLRVYIDGALEESDGVTYVKNASIVDLTRAVSFGVTFEVQMS